MFYRKAKSAVATFGENLRQKYEQSDFGRRYGWWLCPRGKRVADLDHYRWNSNGQFWHEYRLFAFGPSFAELGLGPDRWCQPDVSLESRYAIGLSQSGILIVPREDDVVAIRS